MKMHELDMHCGKCPIMEYCNDYADTPPCSQPRFEGVDVNEFRNLAESSKHGNINDLLDDVYIRLKDGK